VRSGAEVAPHRHHLRPRLLLPEQPLRLHRRESVDLR
jgi:hypothetical protein